MRRSLIILQEPLQHSRVHFISYTSRFSFYPFFILIFYHATNHYKVHKLYVLKCHFTLRGSRKTFYFDLHFYCRLRVKSNNFQFRRLRECANTQITAELNFNTDLRRKMNLIMAGSDFLKRNCLMFGNRVHLSGKRVELWR